MLRCHRRSDRLLTGFQLCFPYGTMMSISRLAGNVDSEVYAGANSRYDEVG